MDVGLSNRSTLAQEHPEFEDVVFLVEATRTERFNLWQEWSSDTITYVKPLDDTDFEAILETIIKPSLREKFTNLQKRIKNNHQYIVDWDQLPMGVSITIGHIKKLPVCIDFSFDIINGKKICFYYCCSRMCDHDMIDNWLIERFQLTHDNYTRWNHTDASNFHNCVNSLDNLDKKPRNTVYKKR